MASLKTLCSRILNKLGIYDFLKNTQDSCSSVHISGFTREDGANVEELKFIKPFLPATGGVMFDVGAHKGESLYPFLSRDWRVFSFEPDIFLFNALKQNYGEHPLLTLENIALSDEIVEQADWFTTAESSGAGSLRPFTNNHYLAGSVSVTTLEKVINSNGVTKIDFLKIDAEGFDYKVLRGFPFSHLQPTCIICEFEDAKTVPLGYATKDMASFLEKNGYKIYVSEWHPILRYGIRHQWKGFYPWNEKQADALSWGNLVAFAKLPDEKTLYETVAANIIHFTHENIA